MCAKLFKINYKCFQELNPDPEDIDDDDEEDDHLYEDAEEEMYEVENDVNERGGGDAGN